MGHRVVVIFDMDQSNELAKIPDLGHQIVLAANASTQERREALFPQGFIAEVTHADNDSLLLVQSLSAKELAVQSWLPGMNEDESAYSLLAAAAARLGYSLTPSSPTASLHLPKKPEDDRF